MKIEKYLREAKLSCSKCGAALKGLVKQQHRSETGPICDSCYKKGVAEVTKKYQKNESVDEEENFKNGDKVYLTKDYEETPGERFTLSQWDGRKGWIGDKSGSGWYVQGYQITKKKPGVSLKKPTFGTFRKPK
jgi:hypothetical protein